MEVERRKRNLKVFINRTPDSKMDKYILLVTYKIKLAPFPEVNSEMY
jgi:hypothetical protein